MLSSILAAQPPVGEWREHLPYNSAIDVTAGDGNVYCATPFSLFSVNVSDRSDITKYSRMTGLSETGVSLLHYDSSRHQLFVAYTNSNIDIIRGDVIHNVPDIKRDNNPGDKSIYNIYQVNSDYYLSTGLGIIIIDGNRYLVRDSWFIGAGGNRVKVNGFTATSTSYYAATVEGLKKCSTTLNGADPSNWITVTPSQGLSAGPCQNVARVGNSVIAQKDDSLFIESGNTWNLFYTDSWPFVSMDVSEGQLAISERQVNGQARVIFLNATGTVARQLNGSPVISFPSKALLYRGEPWVADHFGCLSSFGANGSYQNFSLNSPQNVASGQMLVQSSTFFATAGAVNESWNYQYDGDGIYRFSEGHWENFNRYRYPVLDSMFDFITAALDRRDGSLWAGSFGGGLLHLQDGPSFQIFKQGYIGPTIGDPSSYRVSGLAFDADNNLWISNFGSTRLLRVRKADGAWISFIVPFPLFENAVGQILIDDNNFKWIVAPLGNGLICYDHGPSLESLSDDHWKKYSTTPGSGNLPGNDVYCVAKDKNGSIWVGTNNGVAVIECGSDVFSGTGCDARWPVVPDGNFAGYLFHGEDVRSIAVDGANRKWIATRHGVFLVSETGEKLIYSFTEDNSPLLSSDVKQIAIDGQTGEVYFATLKGICSFRGTATTGTEKNESVLVFPNPVPPGFSGTIAIRGLADNSIVKITELDGRLVFQTRALGGQAVWDGRNYKGQRISSGAYLVVARNDAGTESTVAKIFFIGK